MSNKKISIVMPVFNTGVFLHESVDSVLNQQTFGDCDLPPLELIIVDDRSDDLETIAILATLGARDERIRIIRNWRKKGAAGARNTGILASSSEWVAFIDADDIWFPHALALRWRAISRNPEIKWIAGQFRLLKPDASANADPQFESAEKLIRDLDRRTTDSPVIRMPTPVQAFAEKCLINPTVALVQRALLIDKGMFNENLRRAEDYFLWFSCAFDNDLWMVEDEIAFYRIHSASLTHGNQPRFLFEDSMIRLLLKTPMPRKNRALLMRRFDFVMQDQCFFYRGNRLFKPAFKTAFQWVMNRPFRASAWKELAASSLQFH